MSAIAADLFPSKPRSWGWLTPVILGLIMSMGMLILRSSGGGGEDPPAEASSACDDGNTADDIYVRDGASGAGTSWSDALDDLAATIARGKDVYIADGSYGAYNFNDATSGTTVTNICKATVLQHGTSTGWSDTYGDGQASFTTGNGIEFNTAYWVLDGVVGAGSTDGVNGTGSDSSTYGFLIEPDFQGTGDDTIGIWFDNVATNITVDHVAIEMPGAAAGDGAQWGLNGQTSGDDLTISHVYVNNSSVNVRLWGDRVTVQYSYLDVNWSTEGNHGAQVMLQIDPVFRWNIMNGCDSICIEPGGGISDDLVGGEFYGNLIINGDTTNGFLKGTSSAGIQNSLVANNTFANSLGPLLFQNNVGSGAGTGNEMYNNLCFNSGGLFDEADGGPITHDYNWSRTCGSEVSGEANGQVGAGDPFVNAAGGDFTLISNTNAGTDLGAPYNTDMFGNTRTTWTRGAFEF